MTQAELTARQLHNLNNTMLGVAMVVRHLAELPHSGEGNVQLLDTVMRGFTNELATLTQIVLAENSKPSIILPH